MINLSLGTRKREWALAFYDVCDRAYFGNSFVVTAANNVQRRSFPSLYASVTSVACNLDDDPFRFHFNPEPPTEFLAQGIDVEVAWLDGQTIRTTGQLVCRAAHRRARRTDPIEAPRAAAVPAEDGAVGDGGQRSGGERGRVRRQTDKRHAQKHRPERCSFHRYEEGWFVRHPNRRGVKCLSTKIQSLALDADEELQFTGSDEELQALLDWPSRPR